jgi:hypothetical protein
MSKELLTSMSDDMNIFPYKNESEESFVYRLCYSALGLWCLNSANNKDCNTIGTTKNYQTIILDDLFKRFTELFPSILDNFIHPVNQSIKFSIKFRKVYEEMGYLLNYHGKLNKIANYGRSIKLGNKALFFGLPHDFLEMNGLGVFSSPTDFLTEINDLLIRDNLCCDEYIQSCFDIINFYEHDIDLNTLQFFNPLSNQTLSNSWSNKLKTDLTVAKNFDTNTYHRIIKEHGKLLFFDEPLSKPDDSITSFEYRRLYLALKFYYGHPLKCYITKLDEITSQLYFRGHLPNREYYFILLIAWPKNNVFNKSSFIIKNEFLPSLIPVLTNIGLKIELSK